MFSFQISKLRTHLTLMHLVKNLIYVWKSTQGQVMGTETIVVQCQDRPLYSLKATTTATYITTSSKTQIFPFPTTFCIQVYNEMRTV